MKVYIVDDSISDAILIEATLSNYSNDMEFLIESDPIIAKESISKENSGIDLILLDLNMPKFDGVQMLEYMSQNNINIPVIACSNFIHQYENKLNRNKIIQVISKKELSNCLPENLADIFMKLNSTKSCMVLLGKLDKLCDRNLRRVEFYNEINSLKKELQNFI